MLTQARVLGYVFNPLTVYWCHRPDCVVAEVHNTYGQRYAYLLHPDARGRGRVPKQFYVSPFYPVDGDYRMSLPEPDATLALSVRLDRPDGHSFTASVRGRAVPATARARLQAAARGMHIHRPREFFRRLGASGLIGFGESYMAGDWDSTDLTGLLTVFAAHAADLVPPGLQRLRRLAVRRQPPDDLQTVAGARRNIRPPYDPSNDLFALLLDAA